MALPTCECVKGLPIGEQLAAIYCATYTLAAGDVDGPYLLKSANLSDVDDPDVARGNISAAESGANTDITSLGGVLDIGAGGATPTASSYPVVVATKSGNQVLTGGSTTDVVSFDTEVIDSANAWNTGTNTFTVPANAAGKYEIGIQGFRLNDNGAGTDAILRVEVFVNGVSQFFLFQQNCHSVDTSYAFGSSGVVSLNVGDAVTIRATQFTGNPWTVFVGSGVRINRLFLA